MSRPGQPLLLVPSGLSSLPPLPQSVSTLALWQSEQGIAASPVQTWTDAVNGIAFSQATSARRALLAADGSNFNGHAVVQTDVANTRYLSTAVLGSPLIAAGTKPWIYSVMRCRNAVAGADQRRCYQSGNGSSGGNYDISLVLDIPAGNRAVVAAGNSNLVLGPSGGILAPHLYGHGINASGKNELTIDGATLGTSGSGLTAAACSLVSVGCYMGPDQYNDLSIGLLWFLSARPTAAEEAAIVQWASAYYGTPNALTTLTGAIKVLDPADVVVTSGKIETFNTTSITQATPASRATYVASDAAFNGQPTAVFDAVDDFYPLGDLSALTQGEMFVVLKLANDPPATTPKSGFHFIGSAASSTHYPFTDGVVYDSFGTNARKTVGNPTPPLSAAHVYNVRSSAGNWTLEINGTQVYTTASNTPGFASAALFGASYSSAQFLDGTVAYAVLCNQVQTPSARAAMVSYLKTRFGIA